MRISVLVIAALLALLVVPRLAWAAEIDLGISLDHVATSPQGGSGGSVELGIGLGTAVQTPKDDAAAGTASGDVDLGIALGQRPLYEVTFVGFYCDREGSIMRDASGAPKAETAAVARVAHGESPGVPDGLARKHAVEGADQLEDYFIDGWYDRNLALDEGASPVAGGLAGITVTSEGVTVYFRWREGYSLTLDANNGERSERAGTAVPKGAASGGATAFVSVRRHPEYEESVKGWDGAGERPEGTTEPSDEGYYVAYADFPRGARPGYRFTGWYAPKRQADGTVKADETGKAELEAAPTVPADGAGELVTTGLMGYDAFRTAYLRGETTLYAGWEVDPDAVKEILLDRAYREVDEGGATETVSASLWFWEGRGYVLAEPADDAELTAGAVITESRVLTADDLARLALVKVPDSEGSSYFMGWGHQVRSGSGSGSAGDGGSGGAGSDAGAGGYEKRLLLSLDKVPDESGQDRDVYTLTADAFGPDYVDKNGWKWVRATDAGSPYADTWEAKFNVAMIRVTAPFTVEFRKPLPEGGTEEDRAYGAADLVREDGDGKGDWIASDAATFTNLSTERAVYISAIECTDVGASAIFPGGHGGKEIFALHPDAGQNPASDPRSIRFGYEDGSRDPFKKHVDTEWIVLPRTVDGVEAPQDLYYALNVREAAFKESALVVGDADHKSYTATLANVKYTYSVVP